MLLDEFIECCKNGDFNDFDGMGKYAFKDKMSNKYIYPSNIEDADRDFTHVVWFNK